MNEPPCFNLPVDRIVTAYIGIGTNVGDRRRNLGEAVRGLASFARVEAISSIYETEPVGYKEQADFWNIVVRIATDLPATELLQRLIGVEQAMGRERTFRNAPRIVDLDILLYDDVSATIQGLEIPHPRMHERAFVLKPLAEIAPEATHPRTKQRFADILEHTQLERAEIIGQLDYDIR